MQIAGIVPRPPVAGHSDYHIVPFKGQWMVRQENSLFRQMFPTQREAIPYGSELAREDAVSLIIHGTDGRFRRVYHYETEAANVTVPFQR